MIDSTSTSKDILELRDEFEMRLGLVRQPMLIVAGLILSSQRLDNQAPAGTPEQQDRWRIDRLLTLVSAADSQCQDMLRVLDHTKRVLKQRAETLGTGASEAIEADETEEMDVVLSSVEEYAVRFRSLGKAPMILVFSEEERKVLGLTPLAHLAAMLTAAQVGDKNALEQSLVLARQLAEGARERTWVEVGHEADELDGQDEETTGDET